MELRQLTKSAALQRSVSLIWKIKRICWFSMAIELAILHEDMKVLKYTGLSSKCGIITKISANLSSYLDCVYIICNVLTQTCRVQELCRCNSNSQKVVIVCNTILCGNAN